MDTNSEKYLEKALRIRIEGLGGLCWKWVSPGTNGVPDRIVFMPGNKIYFIELKTKGKTPDPLQKAVHNMLRSLDCKVYVIDSVELLNQFLNEVQSA